jgi:hypothetical protein
MESNLFGTLAAFMVTHGENLTAKGAETTTIFRFLF